MVCAKDARQVTKEPQPLCKTLVRRQRLVEQHGYVDIATGVRTSGCLGTEEVSQAHGVLLEKTLQWLTESIQVHVCSFTCRGSDFLCLCAGIASMPALAWLMISSSPPAQDQGYAENQLYCV